MAVYKVPQDVEAEDKLLGPFSFRQFIYLIVAALGIFMAWLLSRVFIGLIIIPLPVIVAFLALALPLRKDQPMETYLIAMIRFFFKPKRRIWDPEGTISMIQITAPKVSEEPQLKEVGGYEASARLGYLAQVLDSQGWSTRGATAPNDSMSDIFIAETSHAEDVLDQTSGVGQSLDQRISQADDARLSAVRQQFQTAMQQPAPAPAPVAATPEAPQQAAVAAPAQPVPNDPVDYVQAPADTQSPTYNPYPNAMRQHVISPSGQAPAAPENPPEVPLQTAQQPQAESQPSNDSVSPDIIRLANDKNNLSISTLAREAHRLEDDNQEVVISLR